MREDDPNISVGDLVYHYKKNGEKILAEVIAISMSVSWGDRTKQRVIYTIEYMYHSTPMKIQLDVYGSEIKPIPNKMTYNGGEED